ncbi:MAG: hypothetical protein AAF502_07545 [Bacteroidota bacterium]
MNLNFQYPLWFILFCVLAGLVYALILYYRDQTFRERSKTLNLPLGILRFVTVTLLSLLLLSPFLKSLVREAKKPIVVLAQDQSESVISAWEKPDSSAYANAFTAMRDQLLETYEVKEYAFGSAVREGIDFNFSDKESNISDVLEEVYDLYSNQNLGAIVLASDGIYNQGSNPIYAGTKLSVPIYTVALGDTTPRKDLALKKVYHNKIAYLGDKFSIQVDVGAHNCAGANTVLNVYKIENGQTRKLKQEPIAIDNNDFFTTKEIILEADQSGVQRYRIAVTQVPDEVSRVNNVKDIFIDVLDARQKILIVANSPHPDLSALRRTIDKNRNYEATIAYAGSMRENVANYDLVILHQLPSSRQTVPGLLRQLDANKTPRLFIVGSQTNLNMLTRSQSLMKITGDGRNTNEIQPIIDPTFNLFTIGDPVQQELPKFAPLIAPFGNFTAAPEAQVMLMQKIGSVETDYPLLVFGEENGAKAAVLAAEGLWKWKIFDYLQHQNHNIFEEVTGKAIQYLSVKEDKRKFRVSLSKNIFKENEPILFDAELYNESYELVNDPEVSLIITNGEGKDFGFNFSKTNNAYTLNAGYFPVGNYRFRAKTIYTGKELNYNGQFSVQPIQLEVFETTADHNLLRMLGEQYGGQLLFADQLSEIPGLIAASGDVAPVFFTTSKTRSLINLKWIFFVLMGLLTVEWFFRKYFGGY